MNDAANQLAIARYLLEIAQRDARLGNKEEALRECRAAMAQIALAVGMLREKVVVS